jgi:transcriptional regulator with XRE-family HTH domain
MSESKPMRQPEEVQVGRTIKLLRTAAGLKQKDLASRAGIKSAHYLSLIEAGKKEPSLNLLRAIAKALDVPLSLLFWQASTSASQNLELKNKLSSLILDMEKLRLFENFRDEQTAKRELK